MDQGAGDEEDRVLFQEIPRGEEGVLEDPAGGGALGAVAEEERYAERRSGQAGSRAVVSIWWVFLFVTCPFGDGDGSVFIVVVVVVMMAPISVRSSSRRVASE